MRRHRVTQRVYILWSYPLFHQTVSLLLKHPAFTIVGSGSDREHARQEIERLKPDIILLEEATNSDPIDADIIDFLNSSAWEPLIARLSLQDNDLRIYHQEYRTIETPEDLLTLLQK
jgi:DNA-binding NarL/FixJ family response regulator